MIVALVRGGIDTRKSELELFIVLSVGHTTGALSVGGVPTLASVGTHMKSKWAPDTAQTTTPFTIQTVINKSC